MHQGKLAIGQSPDQRHFAGCQTTLQFKAASVHQRSVFNRFSINTFLQYPPYPVHRIKVRSVRRPYVWSDEVWGLASCCSSSIVSHAQYADML